MPSKTEFYRQMADHVATQLTGSWQEWAGFLTTAARLYKYPFHEQLLIYAQRPDATACAEYDLWNEKMGRYVRRGSKGIALVDDSGDKPRLRYVFDITDTGTREHSRTPWLWKLEEQHRDSVSAMLERTYEVGGDDLAQQLEAVAGKLAGEYWNEHRQDFLYIVDDSFLEEYDEFNIEVQFKAAATVSITYALMSRCGLEPERYFDHEDFMAIFDFNTPSTIGALGTAVSQINQQVLRQIGVTIRNAEREAIKERRPQHEESHELHPERRLSDSRPEAERTAGEAPGQVRQDAESIPQGTPSHPIQPAADEREAVPTPAGNRRDRTEPSGAADAPAGERRGRDGAAESQRSDALGGPDEHLQGAGRGDSDGGAYSQLSFFLSENEQIRIIDEAENVKTSSAFSFAQADIDHVLRLGGNTDRQRERIVAAFEKQKSTAEIADTLKNLYHGGNGIGSVTAWYAEDGIHLSHGKTARYDKSAQVISWESAAERIGELLESGQFASNVELAEAAGYERSILAEKLWHLYHDFSDKARDSGYLSCLSGIQRTGFPEETAWLAEQLSDLAFRQTLKEEYAAFWTAYQQDRDLLRFHYHRPREIWENLKDLDLPRRTFSSDLSQVPTVQHFITEDEIDTAMTGGSSFAGGKGRIYAFFMENHTDKEKVRFLKDEYGIGGRSHALSGATHSGEDHDGKGLHYKKQLFSKVRTGQVRVLMGSTAKMGAGTNVQDRLVALHDLDCPWRPGDLAQRKGRIERQGNQNPLVHVYRYVTEGTFDAYLWQTVENKQKFISQIMTSKSPVRSCDDVDETALSFAEIKALCAGDPRIKERMDLDVEVSRLKLMKADHQSKQYRLEDQLLKYFPEEIEKHKGFIKGFESDLEVLAAHPHPEDGFAGMEIRGDLLTDKENAGAALLDACKEVKTSDPVQIGSYRGYAMSVEFSAWKQEYTLLLKGQMTHRATLGTDPRGNLTRIDNALAQMPQRLEAAKAQMDNLYQQQAAAKEEVGKPFLYEEELRSKNARLVELDTLLNIDGKGPAHTESAVAKSTRPSVLDHLKRPVPPRSTDKKPKQHEEVR